MKLKISMDAVKSAISFVWNGAFLYPILNLLVVLYVVLGNNLGIAVIVLTIIIRIVLLPLLIQQIRSARQLKNLKPELDKVKKKYAKDKQKLQQEQLKLYREHGWNPIGGCLPLLIQLPVLIALYSAIRAISGGSLDGIYGFIRDFFNIGADFTVNTSFFGMDLSKNFATIFADTGIKNIQLVPYAIVGVLVGASQFVYGRLLSSLQGTNIPEATEQKESKKSGKKKGKKGKKDKKEDEPDMADMMQGMTKSMNLIMPVMFALISLGYLGGVPSALSLYWVTQTVVLAVQQLVLTRVMQRKG